VAHAEIPVVWKFANIIPIPRPGKPENLSTGYRPNSLLSPCIKVLERLLVPFVTEALPGAPMQHGYKPLHSTTSALLTIVTHIAMGLNEDKPASRSAMVCLNISKAFDAIDHVLLLEKISNSPLDHNVVRWLSAYLPGRTAVCLFQGAASVELKCHDRVPQGSVVLPHLFNFFVSDFPVPTDVNESYADDFDLLRSFTNNDAFGPMLTEDLKQVSKWSMDNKLSISAAKSTVTFFTPWRITTLLFFMKAPLFLSPKTSRI
jgi:hypothetical protein